MPTQAIDLSAGLVPAAAQSGAIDLSSGLTPVTTTPPGQNNPPMTSAQQAAYARGQAPVQVPQDPSTITSLGTGIAKGAAETVHTAGTFLHDRLGIPMPDEILHPELAGGTQANNSAESVGKFGEAVGEFVLGDEALKGLSIAERLGLAKKVTEIAEKSPYLAKALGIGLNAVRTGTVGGTQALAHGATLGQAATTGAVTGATGGVLDAAGEGLSALKNKFGDVVSELRPGEANVGTKTNIPVRASQESAAAKAAEGAADKTPLQKFDIEKTQPAGRKVIGEIATEAQNAAKPTAAIAGAEKPLQLNDAADFKEAGENLQQAAKPTYQKLDALTTDTPFKFSELQKMEKNAFARGDMEGVAKLRAQQERIIADNADEFAPGELDKARTLYRKGAAMEEIHDAINSPGVVGETPVELRAKGAQDPGYIRGNALASKIRKLSNEGTLQAAGLTPEHVQSLSDLATVLEKGNVKANPVMSQVGKQIFKQAVRHTAGAVVGGGVGYALGGKPGAIAGAVVGEGAAEGGQYLAGKALAKILTSPEATRILASGLKSGASATTIASAVVNSLQLPTKGASTQSQVTQ